MRLGIGERFYEKLALKALGIRKIKAREAPAVEARQDAGASV